MILFNVSNVMASKKFSYFVTAFLLLAFVFPTREILSKKSFDPSNLVLNQTKNTANTKRPNRFSASVWDKKVDQFLNTRASATFLRRLNERP